MPLCNPAYNLDITQASGAFLDIRFEVVSGVIKAQVTIVLLFQFGFEKLAR